MKDKLLITLLLTFSLFSFQLSAVDTKIAETINNDFIEENALHDAVRSNDIELVGILIEKGAELNKQDKYGYTPLHLSVRLHNYEITKFLIDNKAEVNTIDIYGDTPLLDSTRNDETNISKILICSGANRNVRDSHSISALQNSSKNKNRLVTNLLTVRMLEPYCQESIDLSITDSNKEKVCGDIVEGYITDILLTITNSDELFAGEVNAEIDNKNKKWCADIKELELDDGNYYLSAEGSDKVVNTATAEGELLITTPLKLSINGENKDLTDNQQICGEVLEGNAKSISIALTDSQENEYGEFTQELEEEVTSWCFDIEEKLPVETYTAKAVGINMQDVTSEVSEPDFFVIEKLGIKIKEEEVFGTKLPVICGDIVVGDIVEVNVNLVDENGGNFGIYESEVDRENNKWCAQVIDILENGDYEVQAEGISSSGKKTSDLSNTTIFVLDGIYEALIKEFSGDFPIWNAELDKEGLLFRFKDPDVLFKVADSTIQKRYKEILQDFFPRYIKILKIYKEQIGSVTIEGHSSSEYNMNNSKQENYRLNQILSQKRADEVSEYVKGLESMEILQQLLWVDSTFIPKGFSSSKVILDVNGTEDKKRSRRVEFRINPKSKQ